MKKSISLPATVQPPPEFTQRFRWSSYVPVSCVTLAFAILTGSLIAAEPSPSPSPLSKKERKQAAAGQVQQSSEEKDKSAGKKQPAGRIVGKVEVYDPSTKQLQIQKRKSKEIVTVTLSPDVKIMKPDGPGTEGDLFIGERVVVTLSPDQTLANHIQIGRPSKGKEDSSE
jgi:hypothetical protein